MTWATITVTTASVVTRPASSATLGEALGVHVAVSAIAGGLGTLLGGTVARVSHLLVSIVAGGAVRTGAVLVDRLLEVVESYGASSSISPLDSD